jgi:hypothetical protein
MSAPIEALRRPAAAAVLLVAAVLATGCGSDSAGPSGPATDPTPAAPTASGDLWAQLTPLIECLRTNGVDLPEQPTREQVLGAFQKLDQAGRDRVRTECGSLVPAGIRDLIAPPSS